MDEVTYNVFLVTGTSGRLEVFIADESVETIEGAVKIGDVTHPSDEDPLGFSHNHVLYHHIRNMLYHLNRDGEPSFWPNNITDMSSLSISYYESEEPEDPEDP